MKKIRVTEKDIKTAIWADIYPTVIAAARVFNIEPESVFVDREGYLTINRDNQKRFLIKDFIKYQQFCSLWEFNDWDNKVPHVFIGFTFSLKKSPEQLTDDF